MNNRLVKVCEDILNDENEFKKFFGIKTLGEIYDYLKGKVPDLSSDEFGCFVAKVLEEYEKQKGNSNVIDLEKLEKIAGGKGFGKRLASGGLALASLLTSQPSLYAAEADKAAQSTDSYLSGKELSGKDSKDRSERSEGNSSSALGYVASILGGAVGGAVAAAGVAHKYWPSSNKDLHLDPQFIDRGQLNEFEINALDGNIGYINDMSFEVNVSDTDINTFSKGLSIALAMDHYEFFDTFMNKFLQALGKNITDSLYSVYLCYLLFYNSYNSFNIFSRYSCFNLINRYNVLALMKCCPKMELDKAFTGELKFYKYSDGEYDVWGKERWLIRVLFERGDVELLDFVFEKSINRDLKHWFDEAINNCDDKLTFLWFISKVSKDELDDIVKLNLSKCLLDEHLPLLEKLVERFPYILNWRISDERDIDDTGKNKDYKHILIYCILKSQFEMVSYLSDKNIIPNWWKISEKGSDSPFAYVEYLIKAKGRGGDYSNGARLYCTLYNNARAQGVGLDEHIHKLYKEYVNQYLDSIPTYDNVRYVRLCDNAVQYGANLNDENKKRYEKCKKKSVSEPLDDDDDELDPFDVFPLDLPPILDL